MGTSIGVLDDFIDHWCPTRPADGTQVTAEAASNSPLKRWLLLHSVPLLGFGLAFTGGGIQQFLRVGCC